MDKHCPVFILECAATVICEKFLTGSLPIEIIAKKVNDHISKQFKEVPIEDLRDIVETFLRVLSEANVEEADLVLRNYAFERLSSRRNGKARNWDSILFDPMKGLKTFKLELKLIRRNFQAFIFRYKQKQTNRMPGNWDIKSSDTNEFIKSMGLIEFNPFDLIDQA